MRNAMQLKAVIKNISKDKHISAQLVMQNFMLERLLERISVSKYRQALRDLGGSATPNEVRAKIIENEQLSADEINATRGKNNVNKFENEVAFARNYLVYAGYRH